ncbi:MAG: 30S ribosomal protein S21, partial [Candidatus Thorarchaeota archaeon]
MSLDLDNTHLDKLKPLGVNVGEFKSFEAAVKKFRKLVEKEGIIKQVLDRRAFMKPSQKRHNKKRQAIRRRELEREEE